MNETLVLETEKILSRAHPLNVTEPAERTVVSPFEVIVDSREQQPYTFEGLRANADQKNALIKVQSQRRALEVGDYSIFGMASLITIERKSKEDLYSSVSQRRENFEQRLRKMCCEYTSAHVVIESEWSDILLNPPKHTQFNPKALARTIDAWTIRWKGVHWWAMPGREFAEIKTYRLLEAFWRAYRDGEWFESAQYRERLDAEDKARQMMAESDWKEGLR